MQTRARAPLPTRIERGVQKAKGHGEPLSQAVAGELGNAIGTDVSRVRVHADGGADRLSREVDAAAFTVGEDVFFRRGFFQPQTPEGRGLLAHELTHVAQQRASRGLDLGVAAPASLAPDGRPLAPAVLQRKPFKGPNLTSVNRVATNFAAHAFQFVGAARATTGCGTDNKITTDGSSVNNAVSRPGTPAKMGTYRGGFSQAGGLVRDKVLAQAATRMHLINHRLENSAKTQRNARNIFLGTQKSNNPTHLNEVEQPVIDAVTNHGTQDNLRYQAAMAAAVKTTDKAGADILFWAAKPNNLAVKHTQLTATYLVKNDPTRGIASKKKNASDQAGWALEVDANTPGQNYHHLWLEYEVVANYAGGYAGIPPYVKNNVTTEENANKANKGKKKTAITKKITDFKAAWAQNAFPPTFDCTVHYYSASYQPWAGAGQYFKETEQHQIAADL